MHLERHLIRNEETASASVCGGYSWGQPIARREKIFVAALWTSACTATVTSPIFYMYWNWTGPLPLKMDLLNYTVVAAFVVCAPVFVALILADIFWPSCLYQRAAVAFSPNDEMWVTRRRRLFQKYADLNWWCFPRRASEVTSIEFTTVRNNGGGHYRHGGPDGYLAHSVFVQFSSGERIYVGEYLSDDDARIVVEQLKLAHREAQEAINHAA